MVSRDVEDVGLKDTVFEMKNMLDVLTGETLQKASELQDIATESIHSIPVRKKD